MNPNDIYNNNFFKRRYKKLTKEYNDILENVNNFIKPQSIIDFGCGNGLMLNFFRKKGCKNIFGVEGFKTAEKHMLIKNYCIYNLQDPLNLNKKYHMVICTSVLEHIESKYESIVLNTIATHCDKWLLFGASDEKNKNKGHINLKNMHAWNLALRSVGFKIESKFSNKYIKKNHVGDVRFLLLYRKVR